jgi:hypothetical protein
MDSIKPWYLSRTIWASIVTVVSGGGALLGLPVAGLDNGALTDSVLQAVTAFSGIIAIFGRLSATTRIA